MSKIPSINLLEDRILIEPVQKEQKTDAGIIIPETVDKKEEVMKGKVVAVGPGKKTPEGKTMPLEVEKGDTVLFAKSFNAKEIETDGKEYLIIREDDVIGITD